MAGCGVRKYGACSLRWINHVGETLKQEKELGFLRPSFFTNSKKPGHGPASWELIARMKPKTSPQPIKRTPVCFKSWLLNENASQG